MRLWFIALCDNLKYYEPLTNGSIMKNHQRGRLLIMQCLKEG